MIHLSLLHEEDSVFQFPLLFPLTPPRTLCAAGSDAPSSLPCRPKSSPGPGSGTCSSSSSPHTWTQRRRRRLVRPAAPSGWREGGRGGGRGERKKRGWKWGRGGVEGSGGITKGQAGGSSRGADEGRGDLHQVLRGRPLRAAPVGPPLLPAWGRFPATPLTRPSGPGAAREPSPGGRLPGVEGQGGGVSETQREHGSPGYCGD